MVLLIACTYGFAMASGGEMDRMVPAYGLFDVWRDMRWEMILEDLAHPDARGIAYVG